QVRHRLRQRAVADGQLDADRVHRLVRVRRRQRAVVLQPQPLAGDVVVRQQRVHREVDLDVGDLVLGRLATEVRDRLADQPDVEVEPDTGDVPGLLAAEQVPGAADLQVLHGYLHAGP